ncbi:MAG: glycosyltransferase family 2 protein [Planctomycetota bacterium]
MTTTELHLTAAKPLSLSTVTVRVMLPAYNEAVALPAMLNDIAATFEAMSMPYHVTVVDDGSSDDTAEVVLDAVDRMPVELVPHPRNLGLAAAMRTGLTHVAKSASDDDIIITLDSDNTQPVGLMPRMIQLIQEGHDVVIASRYQRGSRVLGVPAFRRFTAMVAGILFKCLFPIQGVRDYTCGYRAYRVRAIRQGLAEYGDRFITEEGFSCMVDLLLKLSRLNLIFGEVPMILRYDQKDGASKMPVGRTITQTLKLALRRRMGIFD